MTVSVNGVRVGGDRSGAHGLVVRADGVLRVPRVLGEGRRGDRLGHLRLGRAGRGLGPHRPLTPPPLQVGDVVEMTIERLGTIRNEVVASDETVPPIAPARRRVREGV